MSDIYKLDPRNARTHPEKNKEAVRKSLAELGAGRSIVVDADGVVIGGNAVYEQAKELGIPIKEIKTKGDELVVVRRVDLKTDDPRRKALALADNRIAELAEWDEAVLEELQTELLGEVEFDVMGFDDPVEPLDEDETAVGEMVDRAEELNEKWQVKRGQIWEIPSKSVPGKAHRVMCGDSTDKGDVAILVDKADLCFTSPPYALGKSVSLSGNTVMAEKGNAYEGYEDNIEAWIDVMDGFWPIAQSVTSAQIINVQLLAENKRALIKWLEQNVDYLSDILVWNKGHAAPPMAAGVVSSAYEFLLVFAQKGASRKIPFSSWRGTVQNVYEAPPQRHNEYADIHAATMPVHLPRWVLSTLCDQSQSVFDPFLGTGTTMVAAEQEGRICYGMEIEPKYVAVTLERLSALGLEPVMSDD